MSAPSATIDPATMGGLMAAEQQQFVDRHPRSAAMAADRGSLLGGVPMPWMSRWPGAFPLTFAGATGGRFTDVDGLEYVDFCLGDTGAMAGHSLPQVTAALAEQARLGITTMLPSEAAGRVGRALARRFGLPYWQLAMSATDANRFVLRCARAVTGRPKVLVMDWCYHGTVDETLAILDHSGRVVPRVGAVGAPVDVAATTRVVPFNDPEALDVALAHGDVAAVLMEPALTNIGIVLPEPGYHDRVRALTRRHGVLLVMDETHTICAGPGGCTAAWRLDPDSVVVGKTIAGGMPAAAYGLSEEFADRVAPRLRGDAVDVSGVGGTLTGNALAIAAIDVTLATALREEDFARTIPLAQRWTAGVAGAIADHGLAWHVQRLGCRAEYQFGPPPRTGDEAAAAIDGALDAFLHLWALNRGILLTPFHNMALVSPHHNEADVDRHTEVFTAALDALVG